MKSREPRPLNPRKLDIGAFIETQTPLAGEMPLTEAQRLAAGLAPEVPAADITPVRWEAVGELVPQRVGAPHMWLNLQAQACLPWTCQRCLHPVDIEVAVSRRIRFVADESLAASLDAESDEDVLELSRSFDLLELVEDELIMESPIVPFHDECPEQPRMSVQDADFDGDDVPQESDLAGVAGPDGATAPRSGKPNPFAVLAQLKTRKSDGSEGGSEQG
jgi:uncharacterized protein